ARREEVGGARHVPVHVGAATLGADPEVLPEARVRAGGPAARLLRSGGRPDCLPQGAVAREGPRPYGRGLWAIAGVQRINDFRSIFLPRFAPLPGFRPGGKNVRI